MNRQEKTPFYTKLLEYANSDVASFDVPGHKLGNISNDMIKNKEIILNYNYLKDGSYKLKNNDVFSIKRIGKFKYIDIIKNTKSGNYIISIYKYV